MKTLILIVLLLISSSLSALAGGSQTSIGHNLVEITPDGSGKESWIQHQQRTSKKTYLNARYDSLDRFGLYDEAFNLGTSFNDEKNYSLGLTAGTSRKGFLAPKANLRLEYYKGLGVGITMNTAYQYRHYSDAQVSLISGGVDWEPKAPFIVVSRFYLTQSRFKATSDSKSGAAGMLKIIALLPQDHQAWVFGSSGTEGVLRSFPPQQDLVHSRTVGLGGRARLSPNWAIVPEASRQEYPALNTSIKKIGISIEVNW